MARRRVVLKDPSRFKDPANLTWERYIALQARELERYLAERDALSPEALDFSGVTPGYLPRPSSSSPTTTGPRKRPLATSPPPPSGLRSRS